MAWTLGGDPIPDPKVKNITRDIQTVTHRKLNGGYTRDFIGSEKILVEAEYQNIRTTDMNVILGHYIDQRDNATPKTLIVSQIGFSGSVIIELAPETYSVEACYNLRKINIIFREV